MVNGARGSLRRDRRKTVTESKRKFPLRHKMLSLAADTAAGASSSHDALVCDLPHDHPELLALIGEAAALRGQLGKKNKTRKTLNLIIHVRDANPHMVEHNHFVTSTLATLQAAIMDAKMERHGHTPLPQPQQMQRPSQQKEALRQGRPGSAEESGVRDMTQLGPSPCPHAFCVSTRIGPEYQMVDFHRHLY